MNNDKLISINLEGCTLPELRAMAVRHLNLGAQEAEVLDQGELVSRLSQKVGSDSQLRKELKEKQISFKLSFYLLSVSRLEKGDIARTLAMRAANAAAQRLNAEKEGSDSTSASRPNSAHEYHVERIQVVEHTGSVVGNR